jgi:hypothetical protein
MVDKLKKKEEKSKVIWEILTNSLCENAACENWDSKHRGKYVISFFFLKGKNINRQRVPNEE